MTMAIKGVPSTLLSRVFTSLQSSKRPKGAYRSERNASSFLPDEALLFPAFKEKILPCALPEVLPLPRLLRLSKRLDKFRSLRD